MNGPQRVREYLDKHHIDYGLVTHPHSHSSIGSAISAEVPIHQIAKAVILEDHEGRQLMAILPADYKVSLSILNEELKRDFKLIKENRVYSMFSDCDHGAVPPVPEAYHMDAVYDERLYDEPMLYLECGDHESLLCVRQEDFLQMMTSYKHMKFSHKVLH